MSVKEVITDVANKIRDYTGGKDKMTLYEMPSNIDAVYEAGHSLGYNTGYDTGYALGEDRGHDAGVAEENARCVARHFVTTIMGSGQASISFRIPFEPDYLTINCSDSDLWGASTVTVASAYFDLASFGMVGGVGQVGRSGGFANQAMTTTSILNRYSRAEDGTITIRNLNTNYPSVFKKDRPYMVCAVKYREQSNKERITEYVRSLGESGSVTLNKAKVNAAFTDEEWAALIAEKPGYTFSFV